jgi:hypothetical protein
VTLWQIAIAVTAIDPDSIDITKNVAWIILHNKNKYHRVLILIVSVAAKSARHPCPVDEER